MPHEIFISHTHRDEAIADALREGFSDLFGESVVCQYSTAKELGSGIKHGADWFQWIVDRVKECDFALVLVTPNSVTKPWILWEAGAVYGAAVATGEEGIHKVRPVVFQLESSQIPSPIKDSKSEFLRGDLPADVNKLYSSVLDEYRSDLSSDKLISFGQKLGPAVERCVEQVKSALLEAPLLPSNVVVEEWRLRLDDLLEKGRMSEVEQFHDWMDVAFGRQRDDQPQPLDLRIHSRLGEIYEAAEKHERAIEQYRLSEQLAPRDIYVLRRLGKVFLDAGRRSDAGGVLDRIDELDPEAFERNAECAALKGRWHLEGGAPSEAADVFAAALNRNPDSYYLANRLAEARLEDHDVVSARKAFGRALAIIDDLDEYNVWVLATGANAAFFAGEDQKAAEYVHRMRDIEPPPTPDELQTIRDGLIKISDQVEEGRERLTKILESLQL